MRTSWRKRLFTGGSSCSSFSRRSFAIALVLLRFMYAIALRPCPCSSRLFSSSLERRAAATVCWLEVEAKGWSATDSALRLRGELVWVFGSHETLRELRKRRQVRSAEMFPERRCGVMLAEGRR